MFAALGAVAILGIIFVAFIVFQNNPLFNTKNSSSNNSTSNNSSPSQSTNRSDAIIITNLLGNPENGLVSMQNKDNKLEVTTSFSGLQNVTYILDLKQGNCQQVKDTLFSLPKPTNASDKAILETTLEDLKNKQPLVFLLQNESKSSVTCASIDLSKV